MLEGKPLDMQIQVHGLGKNIIRSLALYDGFISRHDLMLIVLHCLWNMFFYLDL